MTIPASSNFFMISWSVRGDSGDSLRTMSRIRSRTLVAEWLPPPTEGTPPEKKLLSSTMPKGGFGIFLIRDPGNGGLVETQLLGNGPQNQRAEPPGTLPKEIRLMDQQALAHPKDCLLSLLDALQKPLGRAHLFLEIVPKLVFFGRLPEHGPIGGLDAKAGKTLLADGHPHLSIVVLVKAQVGNHDRGALTIIRTSGLRLKGPKKPQGRPHLFGRGSRLLGHGLDVHGKELVEGAVEDPSGKGGLLPEQPRLDLQAFLQGARPDAGRVERLDRPEDPVQVAAREEVGGKAPPPPGPDIRPHQYFRQDKRRPRAPRGRGR